MSSWEHSPVEPLAVAWPAVRSTVDVYLVRGRKDVLIDTAAFGADLIGALQKKGITSQDIRIVLNTHGHADHTGNNALLREHGAAIYMHPADAPLVEDHALQYDDSQFFVFAALMGAEKAREHKAAFLQFAGPDCPVDHYLAEGETIHLDDDLSLEVVAIPGHTPGSVGFWFKDEGVMVAGDSVPGLGGGDGGLPVITDLDTYCASLSKLLTMDISVLHTTHPFRGRTCPPSTVRRGAEVRQYLEESLSFARLLAEGLRAALETTGYADALAATERLIAGLPAELGYRPLSELPMPDMGLATVVANLRNWARKD